MVGFLRRLFYLIDQEGKEKTNRLFVSSAYSLVLKNYVFSLASGSFRLEAFFRYEPRPFVVCAELQKCFIDKLHDSV